MVKISDIKNLDNIREDLIAIYLSAYRGLEEYAYTRRSDVKRYIKWLQKVDRDGLLIAEENGKVVAFIFFCHNWWDRVHGEIGEIHELVVAPECQESGIGKAILID